MSLCIARMGLRLLHGFVFVYIICSMSMTKQHCWLDLSQRGAVLWHGPTCIYEFCSSHLHLLCHAAVQVTCVPSNAGCIVVVPCRMLIVQSCLVGSVFVSIAAGARAAAHPCNASALIRITLEPQSMLQQCLPLVFLHSSDKSIKPPVSQSVCMRCSQSIILRPQNFQSTCRC